MRLDVFEYIEKASLYVEEKNKIIKSASKYLRTYFLDILKDNEEFINVRYRIKTKESINEKLLRQNYFLRSRDPKDVIKIMPDIIGIRVECRFNEDEKIIYEAIQNKFVLSDDAVWYYADEKKNVLLNLREMQPQLQKNGFEIYKVDGRYTYEGESFNFELQIKSMVNIFWGDIDHRILYKNFNYMIREEFIRDLMYSIKYNLTMIDKQLYTIYKSLHRHETTDNSDARNQFKQMVSKMIHDLYSNLVYEKVGIVVDMRNLVRLLVDYLFAKIAKNDSDYYGKDIIRIMNRLNEIKETGSVFGEQVDVGKVGYSDRILRQFGVGLIERINEDFRWNLVLAMIIDITQESPEEEIHSFSEFILSIVIYRVRNAVQELHLSESDKEKLVWTFTQMIFHFFRRDYQLSYFTIESMRTIEIAVKEFLADVYVPEELLALDLNKFYDLLEEKYEHTAVQIGELE